MKSEAVAVVYVDGNLAPMPQWAYTKAFGPAKQGLVASAKSYLKAEASRRLDKNQTRVRLEICESCPHVVRDNEKRYCGACRCGKRARAELRTKARMSGAVCPARKWPRVNDG